MYRFRFCPDCGAPLPEVPDADRVNRQDCTACGGRHFRNAKPCAGALLVRDGQVLLGRRAIEPGRGLWDIPGGFLEPWETPAEGALREIAEETGVVARILSLLSIELDTYDRHFYTLNVYYLTEIVAGEPRAADDLAEVRWFSKAALPRPDAFAFAHCGRVLEAWRATLADRH